MIVGILQFDLHVPGAESLKDKRSVVRSVKDRLHREHQVSVAEVAGHDLLNVARLGLALVGSDGQHVGQTLDKIISKLRTLHDAELGEVRREVLHGRGEDAPAVDVPDADDDLARLLGSRGDQALNEGRTRGGEKP